jgi:hypothetical protein
VIRIKIDDAELELNTDRPDVGTTPKWSGDCAELALWLPGRYGLFGHRVGNFPYPMDVIHALIVSKKEYQVTEGQEILDLPIEPLPEGVIS